MCSSSSGVVSVLDWCAGWATLVVAIRVAPCGPGPGELWRLRRGHFFINTVSIANTQRLVTNLDSKYAKIITVVYTTVMEVDGVKLKELRLDQAYSAQDLAERAGVNYRTILRLEHGQSEAQPRTLRKLAEALGVEPRDLRPDRRRRS